MRAAIELDVGSRWPCRSGKSTLLHLLGAMLPPDTWRILVDDADVAAMKRKELVAYRRTIGFVFQRVRRRVTELLDLVGLVERPDAVPAKLSGGQQQRSPRPPSPS